MGEGSINYQDPGSGFSRSEVIDGLCSMSEFVSFFLAGVHPLTVGRGVLVSSTGLPYV